MGKDEIRMCRKDGEPVISASFGDVSIMVHFSSEESQGVREKVGEILTESYKERLMEQGSSPVSA